MTNELDPTAEPQRGSLLVIFLTVFIDLLGFAMVLPLLPIYGQQFGLGEHGWELALLMSCFSIMQFLFAPLWGRLSDRIGRRPVLIVGLAGSTLFYFLFGVSAAWRSLTGLFLTRIGAGIAGATISTAQAYIADSTTLQTRAKGMALIGAAFGLGFTLGPLIGAAALIFTQDEKLVGTSPWPGYAAAILSGIALLLAIFLLPESRRPGTHSAERKLLDREAWHAAFATPTIAPLLLTSFISVVAFGGFETTLSLLLKGQPFNLKLPGILLYFAYIGVVLTFAQGVLVRRLAGRISEIKLATVGGIVTILGFALLVWASSSGNLTILRIASGVEVIGFAFITPTLQSLISRRSDPEQQGRILGISQSVSALARIAGPLVAIPPFVFISPASPYWMSIGLMAFGLGCLHLFARGGKDYGTTAAVPLH
jgi:MFS family permease